MSLRQEAQPEQPTTLLESGTELNSRLEGVIDDLGDICSKLFGSPLSAVDIKNRGQSEPMPVTHHARNLDTAHKLVTMIQNRLHEIKNKL